MKGYFDSSKKVLYVFPQTPDEIIYVSPLAEAIAVQEEDIVAWKEENTEYADMMVKYNYNIITARPKVWAGHTNDDITYPYHDITLTAGSSLIDVAETAQYTSTVAITPKAGYTVENVNIASPDVEITVGADSWTFTMPDEDVTLAASEDEHTITISSGSEYVTLDKAAAYAGQTVTITPVSPYTVETLNVTSSDVVISAGADSWTFTMIDDDVTLSAAVDVHSITVTSGSAYVTLDKAAAYAGQTVTITPVSPYTVSALNVTSSDVVISAGADSWTFTMIDDDVTLSAAEDDHSITLTGDTAYVSLSSAEAYAGQTVTVTPVTAGDFSNITLTSSDAVITTGADSWTFTMPDNNVTINVTYSGQHDYSQDYLTFTAGSNGTDISFTYKGQGGALAYSLDDGSTWTAYNSPSAITLGPNEKVVFLGEIRPSAGPLDEGIGTFSSTDDVEVSGNIMSLLFSNFVGQTDLTDKTYAFKYLFKNCTTLSSAENLILPATTLANNCYQSMFQGCSALTTAPALPATTLASSCYDSMFSGCTSLTTAPELPATTLANVCYYYMFSGCSSLNYVKCLATDISASQCTRNWLQNVAASGTFVKAASMSSWARTFDGIPFMWTVQDAA